jgi:hypothetical protein
MTDAKTKTKKQNKDSKKNKPNNTDMEEEVKAIRKDVNLILKQQDIISKQQSHIETLLQEITSLKATNQKQSKEIRALQTRVDDLEQYTRSEDLIITGLKVQGRSYARAATVTEETNDCAPEAENRNIEKQVIDFMTSANIPMHEETISACHFLGGPDKNGNKKIVVRFVNRKHKVEVLKRWKNLVNHKVYVSEHLTQKNAKLARIARFLKKNNLIVQTWTRNGRVFAKWKSTLNEQDSVTRIVDEDSFLKCDISPEKLAEVLTKLATPKAHPSTQ